MRSDSSIPKDPKQVIETCGGDAEKAFCKALPVGAPDGGVNPGKLYLALRAEEDPEYRRKEAEFITHLARPMLDGLNRDFAAFFMEWRMKSAHIDKNPGDRRKRVATVEQAMDVPRALSGLLSALDAALRNRDIARLRGSLIALRRLDKDWPVIRRKVGQAEPFPVDIWCANWNRVRELLTIIRRAA